MSRVQLALNVNDIDEAVTFYTKLFGAEPAKRRPGYANFAISEPPLKLVLLENAGQGGSLNHLGVEVPDIGTVDAEQTRLAEAGLVSADERDTTCCYAKQDKFWVQGTPNGESWESTPSWPTARPSTANKTGRPAAAVQPRNRPGQQRRPVLLLSGLTPDRTVQGSAGVALLGELWEGFPVAAGSPRPGACPAISAGKAEPAPGFAVTAGGCAPLAAMRGAAKTIAAVRNRNAAAGETAVHNRPARALAARLAPAWTVASRPNAEPRRVAGASSETAADSAVSPQRSLAGVSENRGMSGLFPLVS